ncbi:MAG: class I SAM-dependent methyltransferase [Lautropia mirabilis]
MSLLGHAGTRPDGSVDWPIRIAAHQAFQLRCPQGELGKEFGQVMNLRNLSMILGALAQLDLQAGNRVLELGAGDGGLLGYLLSRAPELQYIGLDISETMVAQARAFNAPFIQAGLADHVLYDGTRLPLADASFDRALAVNTVYFWADMPAMLAELARVLRPGGRLCLTFAEKAFMQRLPFAAHGFALWDATDIEQQVGALPLQQVARVQEEDLAVSKDGRLVKRPYVHLVMERA